MASAGVIRSPDSDSSTAGIPREFNGACPVNGNGNARWAIWLPIP